MGGIKRKEAPNGAAKEVKKQKTAESRKSKLKLAADEEDFAGFSGDQRPDEKGDGVPVTGTSSAKATTKANIGERKKSKLEPGQSSAEVHAKQRQLAKERKAARPNADLIERSKKIWERLRRKSHVPLAERKQLVAELFGIITGRVQDFVFKHDSVRVIQTGLKYGSLEQRKMIVDELRGNVRELVESKYGKFLVAKMVVEGDQEIRDNILPEFYGHVKRLINHPEASWIVDDIYRQIATPSQKAVMLREWYGPEFALANRDAKTVKAQQTISADLLEILEKSPEKRRPILEFLHQMINSLLQKKLTGFTMLHDAMLQYFLALTPGSEEHVDFLELLKGDIETKAEARESTDASGGGDLFRNLAFTKSGSRLVCLALAYGSAKDRKVILRCFKDTIEMMAFDQYAKMVVVTGYEVPDDTKMTGKTIMGELVGSNIEDEERRLSRLQEVATHLVGRIPLLYPLVGPAKWLVSDADKPLLKEVNEIRKTTSKKEPEVRRSELVDVLSSPLLELVAKRADSLVQSSFGCQFIMEVLLEGNSKSSAGLKEQAKTAVGALAAGVPSEEGHIAHNPPAGRMLRTLVLGGTYDPETKSTKLVEPRLGFAKALYPIIEEHLVAWACSPSSFVVLALLESHDVDDKIRRKVWRALKAGKEDLRKAADGEMGKEEINQKGDVKSQDKEKMDARRGNAGARILLETL